METFKKFLEMAYGTGQNAEIISKQEFMDKLDEYALKCIQQDIDPICSYTSVTQPKQKSIRNPFPKGPLFKISKVKAELGFIYKKKLELWKASAGISDSEVQHRESPYEKISPAFQKLVGTNKIYLMLLPIGGEESKYYYEDENGNFNYVNKNEVEQYLRPYKEPNIPIKVVNYNIENIVGIEIEGKDYIIRDMYERYKKLLDEYLERI